MTLTVTLGDMKRDPYSDLTVKFETLILTFRCSFLMGFSVGSEENPLCGDVRTQVCFEWGGFACVSETRRVYW